MKTARLLSFVAATFALAFSAGVASAATISIGSEVGFIGTYTPTGGTGLADATGLTFGGGTVIIGSDDFAGQVGGSVTLNDLSLTGVTADPFFTMAGGLSFTITGFTLDLQTENALNWTATGFWSLAGFDDTAGIFVFTGDSLNDVFTYSTAGSVVPVPAAVWLFGSALLGLGAMRRRK